MKYLLPLLLLLLPHTFVSAGDVPDKSPVFHPYISLAESEPVKIGSLEFVVAVQKEWPFNQRNFFQDIPVEVQLHIINHGEKDVLFSTFDSFHVTLRKGDGTEVQMGGGRNGTIITKPILIPAQSRYCLCRTANISRDKVRKQKIFVYQDGTGSWSNFDLSPGDYSLRFVLAPLIKDPDDPFPKVPQSILCDGVVIPFWKGEGETKEAHFKVIEVRQ